MILLLALPLLVAIGEVHTHYAPTGDCDNEQVCEYVYSVEQEQFHGNSEDPITVFTTVQIACESNGTYGSLAATRYCMTVYDIEGNFFTIGDDEREFTSTTKQYLIQQYLSGWFCFVQTSEGAVVSVFHSQNEDMDVVNFKKSISAAFQANLKGTNEEIENDPQSMHVSHYSYEEGEDGKTKKMHRTVMTEDVIEYPMQVSTHDIQLFKEEDIEYKEGYLTKSNGTTHISFNPMSYNEDSNDTDTVDIFTVDGQFSLELKVCRRIPHVSRQKRSVTRQYLASGLSVEENLMATFNQTKHEKEELINIRKEVRSEESVIKIIQNFNNSKNLNMLERALILEYKYGTLEGYTPLLDFVMSYFEQLSEIHTKDGMLQRAVVYSLLSAESSPRSQHVLIVSYKSVTDRDEQNSLIIAISTIMYPDDQFITDLEHRIDEEGDLSSPLLLAYGALVSNAAPEIQGGMISFLIELLPEAEEEDDTLIQLIHSLGNTQSQLVVEHILGFIKHVNEEVQLAAVTALRFFSGESFIQHKFIDILIQNTSEALVSAIINALYDGFQHKKGNLKVESDMIEVLMNVTLLLESENLYMELSNYFTLLDTVETLQLAQVLKDRLDLAMETTAQQKRAASTYWPSSLDDFNVIAPLSSRQADVSNYPIYRAYLWSQKLGKTSGTYQFYIQAASGYFAGVNLNISSIKVFVKFVLRLHAHNWVYDAVKIDGLCERHNGSYRVKYTLQIGNTVVSTGSSPSSRSVASQLPKASLSYPLPTARKTLFSINFPIYIYIVTINLGISGYVGISGSVNAQVTGPPMYGSIEVAPRATATIEGSVSLSLLLVAVGATLDVTLPYIIGIEGSAKSCQSQWEICANAFEEWPGSSLTLAAFYQFREIRWCGGWISYPCGFVWGPRRRWNALSFTWQISSSGGRNYLSNFCSGDCPA